jgi:hypothetical protein
VSSGESVNVAVMTQFVAGGFGGSVYKPESVLSPAGELVSQSTAVFSTFGGLLLLGMLLLLVFVWELNKTNIVQSSLVHPKKGISNLKEGIANYITSTLPIGIPICSCLASEIVYRAYC